MAAKKLPWLAGLAKYRFEIFLLLLALLPQIYISLSNNNTILDWYSSDDGFYYFQVARNLASGQGISFDGLNPTNGFHPLWLFAITPIFYLAQVDVLLPLRALMLFATLISAGTAILLFRLLRRHISPWLAALVGSLWIVVPRIHEQVLHTGTEAGLNALCILLFWYLLVRFDTSRPPSTRQLAWLGAAACLPILARLDNVFVVALGGLWLWFRLWQPSAGHNAWRWRIGVGAAFMTPVALVLLAYVSWNQLAFGTLTPVSGQVKLWWGTLRKTVYGFPVNSLTDYLGQFATDHPELGPWSLATAPLYAGAESLLGLLGRSVSVGLRRVALLGLGGALALLVGALLWSQRKFVSTALRRLGLLPLLLACVGQLSYYKLGGSVAQQPWYWMPEMVWLLLALGVLLGALAQWLAAWLPGRLTRLGPAAAGLALALLSIFYLGFIQSAVRAPGDGSNHFYVARARWLELQTQPGERVGATGAGNLAYFIQGRTIVNMDGLMNTVDYLHAMQAGEGATYLAELGLDYVFGNEYILTQTNPYGPMLEGHLTPYTAYPLAEDKELKLWRFAP